MCRGPPQLGGGGLPFASSEANAAALQLLVPMLFPGSNASLWVDASRKLKLSPAAQAGAATISGGNSALLLPLASDGARGAAFDTSLVLRRHWPVDGARRLACRLWAEWFHRAASRHEARGGARRAMDEAVSALGASGIAAGRAPLTEAVIPALPAAVASAAAPSVGPSLSP